MGMSLHSKGSEPEILQSVQIFPSGYICMCIPALCTLDAIYIQNPHWTVLLSFLKPFEPFAIYNSFSLVAAVGQ